MTKWKSDPIFIMAELNKVLNITQNVAKHYVKIIYVKFKKQKQNLNSKMNKIADCQK